MARHASMQFGVIPAGSGYAVHPILGTKNDGAAIFFGSPPLTIATKDVVASFSSEIEAQLWIATKLAEDAIQELKTERLAHSLTKERAQKLLDLVSSFRENI